MRVLAVEPSHRGSAGLDRYQWIEELGIELYVLHGQGEAGYWPEPRYRVVGSRHIDDIVAAARDWHRAQGFSGLFTLVESGVVTVAAIAEQLGLPGIGLAAARASRNKLLMRLGHQRSGAPHPDFRPVTTLPEALAAAGEVGYPAVLKPTLGAASNFVFRVDGPEQLREVFPVADEGSRSMPAITAEAEGLHLGPPGLLLESYLAGSEHLIEACIWDGEAYLGSIVDRLEPEGEADIDENVHCAPTSLTPDQVESVRAAVETAARGQGLARSVLQVEVRFHHGRPYLVEIGARPGGGGLDRMARLSAGHDPIRCLVDVAAGRRPALRHYQPTGVHTAAMVLLCAPGRIERIDIPDDLPGAAEVFLFRLSAKPDDVIRRPPEGNEILGFLGTIGPSRAAALASLNYFARCIEAHVAPVATRN